MPASDDNDGMRLMDATKLRLKELRPTLRHVHGIFPTNPLPVKVQLANECSSHPSTVTFVQLGLQCNEEKTPVACMKAQVYHAYKETCLYRV
jgi:hypothetical protein